MDYSWAKSRGKFKYRKVAMGRSNSIWHNFGGNFFFVWSSNSRVSSPSSPNICASLVKAIDETIRWLHSLIAFSNKPFTRRNSLFCAKNRPHWLHSPIAHFDVNCVFPDRDYADWKGYAQTGYRSVFFVGTNDSYSPTKAPTKEVVNIISAYLVLSIQLTVFTRIKGMD